MNDKNLAPAKEEMLKEIELREKLDRNRYYSLRLLSVKMTQDMGMSDNDIEKALNINIRPQDRQG